MRHKTVMVPLSQLKQDPNAFISSRKVERFAGVYSNTFVGSVETQAERENVKKFLAALLVNVTIVARLNRHAEKKMDEKRGYGVHDLIHYIAGNLQFRINNDDSPTLFSLEDCLLDYAEMAEHFGITGILNAALDLTAPDVPDEETLLGVGGTQIQAN
jgi:hypothetical protein